MAFKYIPDVGKEIRYNRIINPSTHRMVIIPLDHGIILGPLPCLLYTSDAADE